MNGLHASLGALALASAGMAALAFAMDRHYEQLMGKREVPALHRWPLRLVGAVMLAAALLPCIAAWGATVGVVAWVGGGSAGALLAAGGISAGARGAAVASGLGGVGALVQLLWCWKAVAA